jgi:glutamate--cysteine ligase
MPAVDRTFEQRLAGLINGKAQRSLQHGLKGVEKESLRVTPKGEIAQTAHPRALGSALTNEHITTDYSEALIELVTPPFPETGQLLDYLRDIHQFVYRHLEDEMLWATSMPCAIRGEESIPIAQYGSSNVGKMKVVYRRGLSWRYGRVMQAISGVHFNYSFPDEFWPVFADLAKSHDSGQDFRSDAYFALLRNYRRYGWIVLYLFGNSPALCGSFLGGRKVDWLEEFMPKTFYSPHATSLRMSDLGYRNKSQSGVDVSVNSLQHYVRDLTKAISTPNPDFQKIGVKVDGEYRQLNANLLQIENEYYSFIRPKRVARSGERPTKALLRAGVQYVEMRSLDVSAFDAVGVNENKLRFLEAFAAFCVLRESPSIEDREQAELDGNHAIVAREGRKPGLQLGNDGRRIALQDWALEIVDSMRGVCELLDEGDAQKPYTAALEAQEAKVRNVALTPSARSLIEMRNNEESFFRFALRMSRQHQAWFLGLHEPNERRLQEFRDEADASLEEQARIEAADTLSFDEYLQQYFAP